MRRFLTRDNLPDAPALPVPAISDFFAIAQEIVEYDPRQPRPDTADGLTISEVEATMESFGRFVTGRRAYQNEQIVPRTPGLRLVPPAELGRSHVSFNFYRPQGSATGFSITDYLGRDGYGNTMTGQCLIIAHDQKAAAGSIALTRLSLSREIDPAEPYIYSATEAYMGSTLLKNYQLLESMLSREANPPQSIPEIGAATDQAIVFGPEVLDQYRQQRAAELSARG